MCVDKPASCSHTVRTTVDSNPLGVSNALVYRPLDCISEVVLHGPHTPPLVPSMQEALTKACGASEVDLSSAALCHQGQYTKCRA